MFFDLQHHTNLAIYYNKITPITMASSPGSPLNHRELITDYNTTMPPMTTMTKVVRLGSQLGKRHIDHDGADHCSAKRRKRRPWHHCQPWHPRQTIPRRCDAPSIMASIDGPIADANARRIQADSRVSLNALFLISFFMTPYQSHLFHFPPHLVTLMDPWIVWR